MSGRAACGWRRVAGMLVFAAALWPQNPPRIFYSKLFLGSVPEYSEITVDRSGQGQYKESRDDDSPVRFQLTQAESADIFVLAEKLDRFNRPLESHLKVANTGIKTFRFDDGKEKHEVKFNYSTDPNAGALWDWFERIAETERSFAGLEKTARFDKLGVNDALLQLEVSKDHKRLVAAQQFLPILDSIAGNEAYLHMARIRAANLAQALRSEMSRRRE